VAFIVPGWFSYSIGPVAVKAKGALA